MKYKGKVSVIRLYVHSVSRFHSYPPFWRALTVQLNPIDQVRGSCQANTFAYVYLIYVAYT